MKFRFVFPIMLALIFAFVFVMPVLAMPFGGPLGLPGISRFFQLTPEETANLLLGFVGVALSAAFKYFPKWKDWYESFEHQGLLMLGFVVAAGGIYFGLSCTPWAEMLKIQITCEVASVILLIKAITYVAIGNQLAYLYLPTPEPKGKG